MSSIASQITSLAIAYSTVYTHNDQRKHQSSASLTFVWGIHRWLVSSPHKGPVTRKMFPFDEIFMIALTILLLNLNFNTWHHFWPWRNWCHQLVPGGQQLQLHQDARKLGPHHFPFPTPKVVFARLNSLNNRIFHRKSGLANPWSHIYYADNYCFCSVILQVCEQHNSQSACIFQPKCLSIEISQDLLVTRCPEARENKGFPIFCSVPGTMTVKINTSLFQPWPLIEHMEA